MSKEYIEKEAAIRNFCKGCGLFDTDNCICTGKVRCDEYDAILDTPPADVVPVVRCKDCRYFEDMRHYTGLGWCTEVGDTRSKDWYCADGERRK